MLEHLADGSVVMGRTLASQIGVPMAVLSDSGRRLEKRLSLIHI